MTNTWEELESLEANWDSYKANPIDPRAIATGRMVERVLIECQPPQFFPSSDGGVSFELWLNRPDEGINVSLSIEISPEGEVEGAYLG
jgi:hypothetical protein